MPWSEASSPTSWPKVWAPQSQKTVREIVDAVAAIAPKEGVQLKPLADKLNLDKSNAAG